MIDYSYVFDDGSAFELSVDEHGRSSPEQADDVPDWALLDTHRCEGCSLPDDHPFCPAAMAIRPVVEAFSERWSYENVHTIVRIRELTLEATTPTQKAIRSLVGLLLALSSCPVMEKLRPLAHFHLPFAERDHTVFRVFGMYLLAQHLRRSEGLDADWDLDCLLHIYGDVGKVNVELAKRLRAAALQDAAVNSIVMLDTYVQAVEMSFERSLAKLRPLFEVYLRPGSSCD